MSAPRLSAAWVRFSDTLRFAAWGLLSRPARTATVIGSLAAGIAAAEQTRWDPAAIRAHATSFGEDRFAQRVRALAAELGTNVPEPR